MQKQLSRREAIQRAASVGLGVQQMQKPPCLNIRPLTAPVPSSQATNTPRTVASSAWATLIKRMPSITHTD